MPGKNVECDIDRGSAEVAEMEEVVVNGYLPGRRRALPVYPRPSPEMN